MGIELQNYGFKNIVATDYCEEMLEVAGKKGRPDGLTYLTYLLNSIHLIQSISCTYTFLEGLAEQTFTTFKHLKREVEVYTDIGLANNHTN